MKDIYPVLAPQLASILQLVQADILGAVTEIRIRTLKPLMLVLGNEDIMLSAAGQVTKSSHEAYLCTEDDLLKTLQLICKNSRYAVEEELRLGFITIKGGHRVGLCGQIALEQSRIKTFKHISGMNIRLAREVKGCSQKVLSYLFENNQIVSTLIISPPRCGKTTLLRDIIRNISKGIECLGVKGLQVGIVDERSEVAACQNGVPTVDLGPRVDVLDACPKASGMLMLIRSMGPEVLATDELGRQEDAIAVQEALHAGVSVIATVHGKDEKEIKERPYIGDLVKNHYFQRYIILDNTPKVGTVRRISSGTGKVLYCL
ncbi:MAG: stage III sporulation protein AA [Pelosinus sp.]|nr:stage III sporulation protein AA [Pelosinus sp.]